MSESPGIINLDIMSSRERAFVDHALNMVLMADGPLPNTSICQYAKRAYRRERSPLIKRFLKSVYTSDRPALYVVEYYNNVADTVTEMLSDETGSNREENDEN